MRGKKKTGSLLWTRVTSRECLKGRRGEKKEKKRYLTLTERRRGD
jgi:hypothetical protein